MAQVAIKATNVNTGGTVQTSTNESGLYNILSLIPGPYRVQATKTGFDRTDVERVVLSTSQTATVDIVLKIGKVSETVTVSAQSPLLTTTTPTVATTVDQEIATDLPYPERGTLGMSLLVAGVTGNAFASMGVESENPGPYTGSVVPGASLAVGGAPPGRSAILVDGSDVTQASFPRAGITVSGAMVQETTVIVGGIPAQYGRTMGGAIVQSTRGGTNAFHGVASWRHNDPGFNAFPLNGTTKAQNHQQFFGIDFGGPIVLPKLYDGRNRTFFYFGFEPGRVMNTVTQQARVPTPAELQGDFSNAYEFINTTILTNQGLDAALAAPRTGGLYYQAPLNAAGFPTANRYTSSTQYVPVPNNNLAAQLAQNPLAKYLLSSMPTPQNPGPYFSFYRPDGMWLNTGNNVSFIRGAQNVDNRFAVRLDHNLSERDRLFVRFTDVPLTSARFFGLPASFPGSLTPSDQSWANDSAVNETHVISPSMVNEVRLMYMRNRQVRQENLSSLTKDWGASFGLTPATNGAGFPQFAFSPAVFNNPAFGTAGLLADVDENYQFSDDVTWTHRSHTIRSGIDIRRLQSNQLNLGGLYGGSYSFANSQTNNGTAGGTAYASLILGLIGGYTNTPVQVPNYYRWHYYAGFLQDDVKLRPSLTLNIGVRYEVETPRIDKLNYQGTFIPTLTGTLNGLPATGAFCRSGSCGLPRTMWPTNYLGFEPRIGLAWAPTARMTVRSSFNLLRVPLTGYANTANPNFNVSSTTVGNLTGGVVPNQPVDFITNPVGQMVSALSQYQGGGPFFAVNGITIPFVDQSYVTPYAMQWGVTMQFQVDSKTMVQVGYNGLRGVHLITNLAPGLNIPTLGTVKGLIKTGYNFNTQNTPSPYGITNFGSTTVNNENNYQVLLPYQNFYNQNIQEIYNRAGGSIYNALYVNVTRRLGFGLSLQSSFSWSKSIDDTGADGNLANAGAFAGGSIQNPYGLKGERAVSSFDIPEKFTLAYSWAMPFGRGKPLSTHNGVLDAIIGHWTTSGVNIIQAGQPFAPQIGGPGYWVSSGGGTNELPAGYGLRPNIVPGQACINPDWRSNPFGVPYINQAYFSVPGSLGDPQFGNSPRTLTGCRSPRTFKLNASLRRVFPLGKSDKRNISVGLEAQNILNHAVFYLPGNANNSAVNAFNTASLTNSATPAFTYQSSFGSLNQANSQGDSRTVQLSLRLTW